MEGFYAKLCEKCDFYAKLGEKCDIWQSIICCRKYNRQYCMQYYVSCKQYYRQVSRKQSKIQPTSTITDQASSLTTFATGRRVISRCSTSYIIVLAIKETRERFDLHSENSKRCDVWIINSKGDHMQD